jgi:ornithine carbamoyltransferase
MTRHFIDLEDISRDTLHAILKNAHDLKRQKFSPPQIFDGLSLAMIFDKKSTRTRLSFEVAMKQLGGHTTVMTLDDMQISGAESIEDTAHILSRFVDGVMIRASRHDLLTGLAQYSTIPVINGLTDHSHPCQIMADLMTIEEKRGSIAGKKIAWLGDYNNVAHTYVQAAPIFGFELAIATPQKSTHSPAEAVKHADAIVTDTWVSMGQEGKDIEKFWPYQVTSELMSKAKPDALFMHCMPIHRGEEVTEDVLKSPACVIYDEAENRLHAQKAILAWCFEQSGVTLNRRSS